MKTLGGAFSVFFISLVLCVAFGNFYQADAEPLKKGDVFRYIDKSRPTTYLESMSKQEKAASQLNVIEVSSPDELEVTIGNQITTAKYGIKDGKLRVAFPGGLIAYFEFVKEGLKTPGGDILYSRAAIDAFAKAEMARKQAEFAANIKAEAEAKAKAAKALAEAQAQAVEAKAKAAKALADGSAKTKADEAKSNAVNRPTTTKKPAGGPEGMAYVPMGCFFMADTNSDPPFVHEVCLSDFYMDKTEVTQDAYQKTVGNNPSNFKDCPNCPVEQVNWDEAKNYCAKVGKRLPTEAEWEYATRSGGKIETFAGTSDDALVESYAWFNGNAGGKTHPVGEKQPNGLGLYDMNGNVLEWLNDWYDENYYQISRTNNPQGPASGLMKAVRSSCYLNVARDVALAMRTAPRGAAIPGLRSPAIGFRCAQ